MNVGADLLDPDDDYVDFASEVGRRVAQGIQNGHEDTRGIVICGSGVGVDISANKISGIRSCLAHSTDLVKSSPK